ncbi:methylamine utilization protein [Erythrobacter sp.]|uniref:methylamine utilization protein n=1 Tax=Erythrobacter sp. TaxID=1042 RepID=UPI0025EA8296|nr:methylamine utilization protein [Erythrobacter sp.]
MLRRFPFQISLSLIAACLVVFSGAVLAAQTASSASLRVQVVDASGLPVRDAVIELHGARRASSAIRFPWKMGMAQKRLKFAPGTLVVAKGSTVAFPNLDQVRHSIYSFSKPARFEIDLYGRDQTRTQSFPKIGSVKLGCNIHDDMRGYIRVTDTPFAGKTDHNGYITLAGMPAGRGRLTVWHPQLRAPANEVTSAFDVTGGAQVHKLKVALR